MPLSVKIVVVLLGYLIVTAGVGLLIAKITKGIIKNEEDDELTRKISSGIPNAGKYIGWLERILILTFILVGNFNGIGFILAAKGILRFGEIKESTDQKYAEYVIIGTLLSFSLSFMVGILIRYLLGLNVAK